MGKKILIVGAEALPFAATGGLGDVMGSLPVALKKKSPEDDIRVVMPLYGAINAQYRSKMRFLKDFQVQLAWRSQYCGVFAYAKDGVTYYFIDNEYYFKRQTLYGNFDDGERYAFFCMAVMEMLAQLNYFPQILHANDWQSALAVIYLKTKYANRPEYQKIKTIFTIHNIEYQGVYGFDILGDVFGLGAWDRNIVEYNGVINLMKGAIVLCDRLTTVSARYANEIRDDYFAAGLAPIINMCADKLSGIVNGIDTVYYSSEDETLPATFTAKDFAGKAACKRALQEELGLPVRDDVPMIAMVSRLADHKGFDLVRHVIDEILGWDVQFVLLGTGTPALQNFFAELAARHPQKAAVILDFNKALSKRIYAGADLFLMPSKSEPCGLSQMIACAYGTVPVVREVGGLADTIQPFDQQSGKGNGVTFLTYNAHDMKDAVGRAVGFFYQNDSWKKLRANAKNSDFSWSVSATRYWELYNSLN